MNEKEKEEIYAICSDLDKLSILLENNTKEYKAILTSDKETSSRLVEIIAQQNNCSDIEARYALIYVVQVINDPKWFSNSSTIEKVLKEIKDQLSKIKKLFDSKTNENTLKSILDEYDLNLEEEDKKVIN